MLSHLPNRSTTRCVSKQIPTFRMESPVTVGTSTISFPLVVQSCRRIICYASYASLPYSFTAGVLLTPQSSLLGDLPSFLWKHQHVCGWFLCSHRCCIMNECVPKLNGRFSEPILPSSLPDSCSKFTPKLKCTGHITLFQPNTASLYLASSRVPTGRLDVRVQSIAQGYWHWAY